MDNSYNNKNYLKKNIIGISHIVIFIGIYLSNLSYVTFGVVTLSSNSSVIEECKYIWIYNLIGILYGASYIGKGAHTFTVSFQKSNSINDMSDINSSTYIDLLMIPILLIWGCYIQSSISGDCMNIYYNGHKDLWDLCQGTFFGILSMTLVFVFLELFMMFYKKYNNFQINHKYSLTSNNSSDENQNIVINLLES